MEKETKQEEFDIPDMIKMKLHIPVEQYGFVEIELEDEPTKVAVTYFNIKNAFLKVKKEEAPF